VASAASFIADPLAHAGTITVAANGLISVTAPPSGNYDSAEDVVYNVVNLSNTVLNGLTVTGLGISGWDEDGINNYVNSSGGTVNSYGTVRDVGALNVPGTYVGYTNNALNSYLSWTNDPGSTTMDTVSISFGGGGVSANGGTGFISFELPGAANGQINVAGAPLPSGLMGGLGLLAMLGLYSKSSKFKAAV